MACFALVLVVSCHNRSVVPAPPAHQPDIIFEVYSIQDLQAEIMEPLQVDDGLVQLQGEALGIGLPYVFPVPTSELPSVHVTLEQAEASISYPFTVTLSGVSVPLPKVHSRHFAPKGLNTYMDVQLTSGTKEIQDWDIPILHLRLTTTDTAGQVVTIHRYYLVRKQ